MMNFCSAMVSLTTSPMEITIPLVAYPAVVKADFEKAGFVLEATSDLLRNPDDDHSKLVFDPSIRGKTDRFVLKFRKPK